MDPKWDRWDPALDCRWEAAFALDPRWTLGGTGGIPPRIPGERRDPT